MLEEQPPGDVMGKGQDKADDDKPVESLPPQRVPAQLPQGYRDGPSGGPGNSD